MCNGVSNDVKQLTNVTEKVTEHNIVISRVSFDDFLFYDFQFDKLPRT